MTDSAQTNQASQPGHSPPGQPVEDAAALDDEISLLDLLLVLARQKRWVIGVPAFTSVLALIVVLLMPPIFTSKVVIMPPQQQGGGALAMLGDMAGMAGLAGAGKSPGDLYAAMLDARPIQDAVIDRFDLMTRYESEYRFQARKALSGVTSVKADKKSGLISIEVEDPDPAQAAKMAEAYVEELQKLLDSLAISEAARRRLFFEKQLAQARDNLANAELALRSTQESTKLVQPERQIPAIFSAIAQLRGTIAAKEVEITSMKTFATAQNPDLKVAQQELAALKSQLNRLQRDNPTESGDFLVPSARIPASAVDYVRAMRDVKYHETVFELLAKQFELAKIDEAREATLIQIVEQPVPAEWKSKPKRALIVLLAALAGLMLGLLSAFVIDAWSRAAHHADSAARIAELRRLLGWRVAPH